MNETKQSTLLRAGESSAERLARLIGLADKSGLANELEERIERDHLAQRRELSSELATLTPDHAAKANVERMTKRCQEIAGEVEKAERRLRSARDELNIIRIQIVASESAFEARRRKLEHEIRELAPEYLHEHRYAYSSFLEVLEAERWRETSSMGMGEPASERLTRVRALTDAVNKARDGVEQLMLDVADPAKVRSKAEQIMRAIVDDARHVFSMQNLREYRGVGLILDVMRGVLAS